MEIKTLHISIAILSLCGFLVSIYMYKMVEKSRGALHWLMAVGATLLGTTLISLRGIIPDFFSILLANLLLIATPALGAFSIRRFFRQKGSPAAEISLQILFSVLFLTTWLKGGLQERILVMAAAYIIQWALVSYVSLRNFRQGIKNYDLFIGFTAMGMSLVSVFRLYNSLNFPSHGEYFNTGGFQVTYLYLMLGIWFTILFGYVMMVNRQLTIELNTERLLLQNANNTKDRFFSLIAHDLRGPIGSVMGIMELLAMDKRTPDQFGKEDWKEHKELIELTHRQTKKNFNLLEDLLSWAKAQQNMVVYNKNIIRCNDIIESVIDLLRFQAGNKGIHFNFSRQDDNAGMEADIKTVKTALRNILSNAIKFGPRNSTVDISVSRDNDFVTIHVTDHGSGMSPEKIEEIMTNDIITSGMGTEGETGTGMGLKLVREYIRGNNGQLNITSSESGTCISVSLPAVFIFGSSP